MEFEYQIQYQATVKIFLQNNDFSKKSISAIKRNGALLVNGKNVTVRAQMSVGDTLCVKLPNEQPSENLMPFNKPLNILFEDDYLLIVSKTIQQNCAPSRDHKHFSLVEQVLGYFQQNNYELTPHIITRLDRNTSGIVIIAKHGYIHHLMSQTMIDKRYLCICHGEVDEQGIVDAPIGRHPDSIIQRQVNQSGKEAKTVFRCIKVKPKYSLCEVRLITGRTHQIRVHFQYIGHSLVGDDLYGGKQDIYNHQMLGCKKVSFIHPINKKNIEVLDKYDTIEKKFNML
ncbi:RluA family pseudouridine synthase [Staphylococcus sp. ACRSN]|uniref:RluA family pseudouridine synthase n=1 Tax=Staphylococcus sp. ACRSN TaxID=2918214 RepID=UPI001EF2983B|nr:RluA family pseudouridine synthase [Staphylococcus sp. ACRSN]MCG7339385.1 RluA family pseudouridine synthase [Staphylococcus sp. ACRSN]